MIEKMSLSIYEKMINTITDGILFIRPDGRIRFANSAMEHISGYSSAELLQDTCVILNCDVCEKARSKSRKSWCGLFATGKESRKHCHIERKDGSYAAIIKTAILIQDDQDNVIGALEVFTDLTEIKKRDQEIEDLSHILQPKKGFHGIIGQSRSMQQLFATIEKVAHCDSPVIITGETGTGKELVARAIHNIGRRKNGPYVQFNCAALNESLCESELFGHTRGAFTGAHRHRKGRFESADGGDLFLDEIGEISLSVQAKLLRVLETKQFERVGDSKSIRADVRVIAATNKDLSAMVGDGRFREDLFYRVNVVPLHLPPLRQRREDLPLLVKAFINRIHLDRQTIVGGIGSDVMDLFLHYPWQGNIRELKSALEFASIIAGPEKIQTQHLPEHLKKFVQAPAQPAGSGDAGTAISEKEELLNVLRQCGGNKTRAAKKLGVHRMTVWNRMKKYGIETRNVVK